VGSSDISACGVKVNCGNFTDALVNPNSFGFYFRPNAVGNNNKPHVLLA
jgi:hypothetical protein